MASFGISCHVSPPMLRSSVLSETPSSFPVLQSKHKYLSRHVTTTHYNSPFPKYHYQVWSKGHQEKYRFVAGMSSSSSPLDVNPKRNDDKEKSGAVGVKETSWIDLYLPEQLRPYAKLARLDKPVGLWLFGWPYIWSYALAADPGSLPSLKMMGLFSYGVLIFRSLNCTISDLFDRDIDAKVERTRSRPIASGLLTPFQGIQFLGLQLLLFLGILLQLNYYSIVLGSSSLLLVFSYPLMKRITYWPQAFCGLLVNWGALLGWAAVKGSINPYVVFPLYMSGVFWTIIYDTIYAHQDKEDDVKVGVKSTALMFCDNTKLWLIGFATTSIGCLALSGLNAKLGCLYYASLVAASGHLGWQIGKVNLSSPDDCNRKFVSNQWYGAIIFIGVVLGRIFQ